jgi:hypothetical protein
MSPAPSDARAGVAAGSPGLLVCPSFLVGAGSWRADGVSRLGKPSRSDARKGDLDAAAGSGTMSGEEDGYVLRRPCVSGERS